MGGRRRGGRIIELEARRTEAERQRADRVEEPHPLYGVALLKTALELKKQPEASVDEVLRGVLARMRLPEESFRAWLRQQDGLLRELGEPES